MADVDDKEKAEKLAAAKKRFEELKKKQKGKKGGKKKADKADATEEKDDATAQDGQAADADVDAPAEGAATDNTPVAADTAEDANAEKTEETLEEATASDETPTERPTHERKPSQSEQSRQRSASFRQNSGLTSPSLSKSPALPSISAEDEVQDIYRKQASRIEELEKENKTLQDAQAKLQKVEDELEQLRESSGDIAELKSKAALADKRHEEIEKLTSDLTSVQRQLSQAQQQVADKRRKSNASPSREIQAQLASKTSTIESLELELSNLRNQYNMSQSSVSAHEATIKELEQRATAAEQASETAQKEIGTLKETISKPVETEKNDAEDPAALQAKITTLESDLRAAQSSADTATSRASSLEQKIEALTKLHKDQTSTHDSQIKDLTSKLVSLKTSQTPTANDTDSITDDANDLEREQLHQRIRDLEAENTDLRRGVWRDQRAALQPDINDASPGYEDVDLSNPYAAPSSAQRPHARTGSSFQDVLQSGISAFTGGQRKQSLGLLSEEDFDEDSFRVAQEEEGKKRIERIREVKRGLEDWRGWRVDLVDLRAGGLGGGAATGPVFEV
ncbi:unnamed protein product [Aureobasidium vineae]|uniref:M protein repeat protein n=1 Tax=Aureobasidium vineae TaxID=2773715 RepID=A0A9N8JPR5_9PEZI|nr:unnamed protein product [Aureobasidium vineae]